LIVAQVHDDEQRRAGATAAANQAAMDSFGQRAAESGIRFGLVPRVLMCTG